MIGFSCAGCWAQQLLPHRLGKSEEAAMPETHEKIDLNSDVGESFGRYRLGLDESVIPLVSSANIACGYHAGDPHVMRRTVRLAKDNGVGAGAHPGLPDLMGFGRRGMEVTPEEIKDYVTYQLGALQAIARSEGVRLQHVKPHGALYNMAAADPGLWAAVAEAMASVDRDLILFVLGGGQRAALDAVGERFGIRIAHEFFADRAYNPDGTLVSRRLPGAVIHDHEEAARRVLRMVTEGRVASHDGQDISLSCETVCVHGDNPQALELVRRVRDTLHGAGVEVAPVGTFL
jgi:UPF0271 protein